MNFKIPSFGFSKAKILFFLIFLFQFALGFSQITNDSLKFGSRQEVSKEKEDSIKREIISSSSYKCWKLGYKTSIPIDTAISIESYYSQNFTQRDQFGSMEYPNMGQTYNPLQIRLEQGIESRLLPTGKSFNYTKIEDICYFDVKTPTTEIVYENGVREGQSVQTTFTHSINKNINYFIGYHGIRSFGRYLDQFASTQKFLAGLRFSTNKEKYKFWTHFITQNIDNQENAGLTAVSLDRFLSNNPTFANRLRLDVNLTGAESQYNSRRFYFVQFYDLKPNLNSRSDFYPDVANFGIKHIFTYEDQEFLYQENQENTFFTSATDISLGRRNNNEFTNLKNDLLINFKNKNFGFLEAGFRIENLNYRFPTEKSVGFVSIPELFQTDLLSFLFNTSLDIGEKLSLKTRGQIANSENFKPQRHFRTNLEFKLSKDYIFDFSFLNNSAIQNYNYLFHQSFYDEFNYNNNLENTENTSFSAQFSAQPIRTTAKASFSNINSLPYLDENFDFFQSSEFNLLELELKNDLKLGNYHWANRVVYQKMDKENGVFPIPEFILRSTFYYQNKAFKENAEIQTGINVYYFSQFQSRTFFPVLNEFVLSDSGAEEIGNYPFMDAFINMRVKRMRIYLRAQHFNSLFFEDNYLSDPNTPYRDFKIQMGLRWLFFS